jgi:hypothetical protein
MMEWLRIEFIVVFREYGDDLPLRGTEFGVTSVLNLCSNEVVLA